jgi:GT2 family glycosyltransferase/glycosyltransferase involved in cell wall biosynthesis
VRILIVVHGFPPKATGGTEVYAELQAHQLAALGDHVSVFAREADSARREYAVRDEYRGQVRVQWVNRTFRDSRTFADTYISPRIAERLSHFLDQERPEVAHIHHLTCLSTSIVAELKRRGIPVVLTLHDYWMLCHRGQLLDLDLRRCVDPGDCHRCLGSSGGAGPTLFAAGRALKAVEQSLPPSAGRMLHRAAIAASDGMIPSQAPAHIARLEHMRSVLGAVDRILAPSRHMRDRFEAAGVESPITLLEYGIAANRFTRGNRRTAEALQLGYLGSLMVSKAPHLLLEACRRLPATAVHATLAGGFVAYHGDDSYRATLEPLLGGEGVTVTGSVTNAEVPRWFTTVDALVVPSIWEENSPLVIREAFAAGVPVVASRIGGIPETVTHDVNGLLFEPGSVEDLTRQLRRLIDEPDLLMRLRAGIPRVRTIEEATSDTRDIYESVVRPSTSSGRTIAPVPFDTVRPEPFGTVRPEPFDTVRPEPFGTVRPEPVEGTNGAQDRPVEGTNGAQDTPVEGTNRAQDTPVEARTRVAAVVLNYRTPDETLLAVRSLLASRRPFSQVIVVDNAADDECRHALGEVADEITFLSAGDNTGFSAGVNLGVRRALADGATHVMLVNSDVVLPVRALDQLLETMVAAPNRGIASPVIAARTAPDVVASAGMRFSDATGRMRHLHVGASLAQQSLPEWQSVAAVSGCAMLVSRPVFDAIGLLPEPYFFSFEDLAFCLKAREHGFDVGVAGRAVAYHEGSRSMGAASTRRLYFGARNHLLLASSRPGGAITRTLRGSAVVGYNVAYAAIAHGGSLPGRLTAVFRGVRDHLRGHYGADRES